MSSLARPAGPVHVGMDTSKNTIMVAVLAPGQEVPVTERIANEEPPVRRLLERVAGAAGGRGLVRCCYEAGPGGYDLYRLVDGMGIACEVVAPSLIPKGSGERVKTDRRDAVRLARLHRAGALTAVRVPSPAEEAVRDLVRARAAVLDDRKTAQQRLTAVLMRHGRVWRPVVLDQGAPGLDRGAEVRRAGPGDSGRFLPGGAGHQGNRAGRDRGAAGGLGRAGAAGRGGGPAGVLPRHRRADRADPGRRGGRLAPVPLRPGVHGVHRAVPGGELQRR